jgi:hypothetical protein
MQPIFSARFFYALISTQPEPKPLNQPCLELNQINLPPSTWLRQAFFLALRGVGNPEN